MKSIRAEARKERRYSVCSFDESIGDSEIIDDQYETKRLLKKVMKHMKELTDVQQRRLRLYFFENKTFKEIAAIEGGRTQVSEIVLRQPLKFSHLKNIFKKQEVL